MANLILVVGITVLSFCVVTFFVIAFVNVIEYLLAKRHVERLMEDDVLIVEATEDDCCCHECCGCCGHCHTHDVESVHDEEE